MQSDELTLGKGFEFEVGGKKYVSAPCEDVIEYKEEVQELLEALGHPEAWVSDLSTIDTFPEEDVERAANTLGIKFEPEMTIVEAAKILAAKSI